MYFAYLQSCKPWSVSFLRDNCMILVTGDPNWIFWQTFCD